MSQKNSFNKLELLSMANGDMFGQDNAKLPLEPMLMVDRNLDISNENSIDLFWILSIIVYGAGTTECKVNW